MANDLKILLVEDLPTDAELAQREIQKEFGSCEFLRVEARDDFVDALDTFRPDIIISDYMLPRFNGMEALRIAQTSVPSIPFVVFTGSVNEDTAVACMKAGAWDYVIKEHIKRLGPAIRASLEEKRIRVERERARNETERAYQIKNEFLSNMSHELRTPLNGILGMFTILESLHLGDEERFWLSMAKQSAEKLNRIIIDLLDFIQIESSRINFEKESFSLNELISSVTGMFQTDAGKKELDVQFENRCSHSLFVGDKARIAQILWNLLSNAVKFSSHGTIRVEADEQEDSLFLAVEDEGTGIDESRISDIFLPLQQLESPYTKEHPGVGLGLAIVKEMTALMGGTVRVDSAPGRGSRFEVLVPGGFEDEDRGVEAPPEKKSGGVSGNTGMKKILVVEDESINRLYVTTLLKKSGFIVCEAQNGEEAVHQAYSERPDLILMDIGLPVMDGLEASKRIIEEPATSGIPILALTAHARQEERERFLEEGMREVITKPFQKMQLLDTVCSYLDEGN